MEKVHPDRPEIQDAYLVRQTLGGSREACGLLVLRYSRTVRSICLYRVGSRQDLDDMVQETLSSGIRGLAEAGAPRTLRTLHPPDRPQPLHRPPPQDQEEDPLPGGGGARLPEAAHDALLALLEGPYRKEDEEKHVQAAGLLTHMPGAHHRRRLERFFHLPAEQESERVRSCMFRGLEWVEGPRYREGLEFWARAPKKDRIEEARFRRRTVLGY